MKRRRPPRPQGAPPDHLLRYDPADWPGGCHPTCQFWAAWDVWHAEHPEYEGLAEIENPPDCAWHEELI
ncbi:hypothetical protein [Kribbella sp. NPDC004536]|uniref:hypothetical protein n=1 Tax=Kribbella sp. NPDC004536 TaxID=3364106 RepID=UPI0036A01E94